MSFKYNENNAGNSMITKAGEYEVYPNAYEYTMTNSTNRPMITMNYKVRDDVDQEGAGSEIRFDNFVHSPKSDWRFNALTKATGAFEDDHDFGNPQGWAEEMLGKPIRVKVKIEESNGKQYPSIASFKPSQEAMTEEPEIKQHDTSSPTTASKPAASTVKDPFADGGESINISDDDLPF